MKYFQNAIELIIMGYQSLRNDLVFYWEVRIITIFFFLTLPGLGEILLSVGEV